MLNRRLLFKQPAEEFKETINTIVSELAEITDVAVPGGAENVVKQKPSKHS